VADAERREAAERLRRERLEQRRQRAAAEGVAAERVSEQGRGGAAATVEAAAEAKPLPEQVASGLGSLIGKALAGAGETVARAIDDIKTDGAASAAAEEERRRARRQKKSPPASEPFTVRLVRGLPGQQEAGERSAETERSRLVGSVILVDSLHPDFQARWRQTRQGAPKVDERLCGYLATVVSAHYRERAYQSAARQRVDYTQAYEELIGTYCRLEEGLRAVLPALLREMQGEDAAAVAAPAAAQVAQDAARAVRPTATRSGGAEFGP